MNDSPDSLPATSGSAECQNGCRLHRAMQPVVIVTYWLAAAVAAISLHEIPCEWDETLCGVWGCLPPLMSLVALHLLWGIALGTGVHLLARLRPDWLRRAGILLILTGIVGGCVIHGIQLSRWIEHASEWHRAFWPQRLAYQLAVGTDFPAMPSLLAGMIAWGISRRRRKRTEVEAVV